MPFDFTFGIGSALGSAASAAVSAKIASDNRKFQERMTKNRYQYQMADMKKAGLNPILASGQAPPGAPPGAMASIPDFGKSFSGGYSAKAGADLANQQAQTELDKQSLLGMQEALTANQAKNSAWMAKLAQLDFEKLSSNDLGYWATKAGGPVGGAVGVLGKGIGTLGKATASGAARTMGGASSTSAKAIRNFLLRIAK